MRNTMVYLVTDYITGMIGNMLASRYEEMGSNPDTPFATAFASYDNYLVASTEDALSVGGVAKGNDMIPSFKKRLPRTPPRSAWRIHRIRI